MQPGTILGPYEVAGVIGKGGMGEVYRARDARLQRDVAIKVLPPLFARDPERLARFEREARTLAALNHPHVAQVYGVIDLPVEAGGHGLVMEFVDGEDLSQRLARAGAIPIDEALPIALQVAGALEAAHEQGIVHRDLKPANIKVRHDGQVKVLDFGLAKALAPVDPAARESASLDNSPTITSPFQMSQLGAILGTAAYMAPEQAKGKPIDKRADIWAFGCVLYEMLTGTRPFTGEDVTDTLAAIVRGDPDWSALPRDTPPHVRTLLRRCLEKDRRERLPDIGAARLELKEGSLRAPAATAVPPRSRGSRLPWVLFAATMLAGIAIAIYAVTTRPSPDSRVYKSSILTPAPLSGAPALRFQISPDGRRLAFVAPTEGGQTVLWIRQLDGLTAQPIAGTLNALAPFWSPDSRWVAFFAEGKLKKLDPSTGSIISICDASSAPPGTWNSNDIILFTGPGNSIARVPASGGKPTPVTRLHPGEGRHICPFFLPDERQFLFTVSAADAERPGVFVGSLDGGEPVRLLDEVAHAYYAEGRLLYLRDRTLLTQPFDYRTRTVSGSPVPIVEGLQTNPQTGTGAFSVSRAGVLVYQTGVSAGTQLTWFDRSGKAVATIGDARSYRDVELSPDGKIVSVTITSTGTQGDVWLFDVPRSLGRRLTFGEATVAAVWSPDSRYLVYGSRRDRNSGSRDLYRKAASGSEAEELLLHDENDKIPLGITPDGRTLLYRIPRNISTGELWLLPLQGERKPHAFNPGNASQSPAAVSPNGKWLAYASNENGRTDIFVTSFPAGMGKWQISAGGGDTPRWRADGKELFFTASDRIMAVDVDTTGDRFESGAAHVLFSARVPAATLGTRATFTPSLDGQRLLVNTWDTGSANTPITLLVNWPASIK